MFDESHLNQTIANTFCNKKASWIKPEGTVNIMVSFNQSEELETEDHLQIGGEMITAECESSTIKGMKRKQILIIETVEYSVMNIAPDGNGWSVIRLEKS